MSTCSNCRFWTGNRTDPKGGQCRRYPPAASGLAPRMVGRAVLTAVGGPAAQPEMELTPVFSLPSTAGDFWCGDFAPETVS